MTERRTERKFEVSAVLVIFLAMATGVISTDSGRDTPEYRTVFTHAIDLRLAFHKWYDRDESRFVRLLGDMGLDQSAFEGKYESNLSLMAAVVWQVQRRVEVDAFVYHTIIRVLENNPLLSTYTPNILSKLRETYAHFQQGTVHETGEC